MSAVKERPECIFPVYRGEGEGTVAMARRGWTVELRNVRVRRLAPGGSDWLVEALPEDCDESDWKSAVFDGDSEEARIHLPSAVRLTQRSGCIAQIDRRSDPNP